MRLRATGLDCAIGGRTILRGVDLAVEPGEVLGFVGPNGSGKSTLLRVLAGIRPAAAGQILLDGQPLSAFSARQRARRIAMVGQEEELPADLLVGELVALGLVPHRAPWAGGDRRERETVLKALSTVDLADAVDRPAEQLSGGERRRVLLARGLAQDAPLLVLDEPTNHLDIRHQLHLLDLVRGLDRTVLLALHDLNLAADVCDRVVVLHDGQARPAAAPAQALTPRLVHEVFGVRATRVTHPDTGRPHLLFTPTLERP
ncbi:MULTISPECIES: ABC transporter ATP-binding protein [unclassified Crossiella]|uniref:ABC transporter ATP-binding protein n=1 Tax=unclassified Crossiella TaxID=2620835 RepID=UPI002000525E|nr:MULTISPECIES: ABC transporter ATP-binding protein [unclassified Crossiella]MCK2238575.1 ABC transporter ATP-binding protein [Crossiella sp. S99.2]MCK2251855.1 ABC transporter ATP-binding protein [Crossiella sp. S99.1]